MALSGNIERILVCNLISTQRNKVSTWVILTPLISFSPNRIFLNLPAHSSMGGSMFSKSGSAAKPHCAKHPAQTGYDIRTSGPTRSTNSEAV